jgi:hypothetical protein
LLGYDGGVTLRKGSQGWDPPLVVLAPTALIAIWSVLCAALVHQACFDIIPPFPEPIPGTARAGYCDSVNSAAPWVTLTLGPTALMGVIGWVCRRRPRLVMGAAFLLALLLIANATVASNLAYSLTLEP